MRKFLQAILKSIVAHQRRRAAYWQIKHLKTLEHMTQKDFEDIGLSRGEIYYALYHNKR